MTGQRSNFFHREPYVLFRMGLYVMLALCLSLVLRAETSDLSPSREQVFPSPSRRDWVDAGKTVKRGLRYLLNRQTPSGSIGSDYQVAVTSLAGLAVLGAGHQPTGSKQPVGSYGSMLAKCLDYLESCAQPRGAGLFLTEKVSKSRMHGHCYAVLFLCELRGSMPGQEERIKRLIKGAVKVIEGAQSRRGGWFYTPQNPDHDDEASVTVCALQALRAARNVGCEVRGAAINGAIRYVKDCQNSKDGSFAYSFQEKKRTSYALTVAALSTLNAAGVYKSKELQKGFGYLTRSIARVKSPWKAAEKEHDFYANLYAAQALYQDGGVLWERWYPGVRRYLMEKQKSNGSWRCDWGDELSTAMALLILEIPLGYLPIFER